MYARANLEVRLAEQDQFPFKRRESMLAQARQVSFYLYNPCEKGVNLYNADKCGFTALPRCCAHAMAPISPQRDELRQFCLDVCVADHK